MALNKVGCLEVAEMMQSMLWDYDNRHLKLFLWRHRSEVWAEMYHRDKGKKQKDGKREITLRIRHPWPMKQPTGCCSRCGRRSWLNTPQAAGCMETVALYSQKQRLSFLDTTQIHRDRGLKQHRKEDETSLVQAYEGSGELAGRRLHMTTSTKVHF